MLGLFFSFPQSFPMVYVCVNTTNKYEIISHIISLQTMQDCVYHSLWGSVGHAISVFETRDFVFLLSIFGS